MKLFLVTDETAARIMLRESEVRDGKKYLTGKGSLLVFDRLVPSDVHAGDTVVVLSAGPSAVKRATVVEEQGRRTLAFSSGLARQLAVCGTARTRQVLDCHV